MFPLSVCLFLCAIFSKLHCNNAVPKKAQRDKLMITKEWNGWYPWKECSKSCGVGYTSRGRLRLSTATNNTEIEVQTRTCIINLNEDCTIESGGFWTKNDSSKLWTLVIMFIPVYMWLYTCLHWQKKRIGNLWDIEKETIPLELQTLSPSKRRLHMEMMRNLKILHMQMEEQQKVEKQLKDMENLKDNLLSLGLV